MNLAKATDELRLLFSEFDTETGADASRLMAAVISPAIAMGGLLGEERLPAMLCTADKSQTGKTYGQQCIAACFREVPYVVTRRKGGVGGMDESFSAGLLAGRPFIQIDNLRGELDSEHVESYMTATYFNARVPHRNEMEVNTSRFTIMLTSNGLKLTPDMENRCSLVRLVKRAYGVPFRKYREGDLLAHIKANQPYYLGCIFTVVRAWVEAGRPRTEECRHDFRAWAQSMDWIVQNLFTQTETWLAMPPLFQDRDSSAVEQMDRDAEEFEDLINGFQTT